MRRDVQLSLVEGMDRPVGPILQSVFTGANADLIRAVAPLYLTGSVLDVTYGRGNWWTRFTPEPFTWHDLDLDGVDFRDLPYRAGEYDTLTFDPPYVTSGGPGKRDLQARYGTGSIALRRQTGYATGAALLAMILDGLAEVCRVARRFVLVKCMEYASGDLQDIPTAVTNTAAALGWKKHDQIVHWTGQGPAGWNTTVVRRALRVHSYLIVFVPAVTDNQEPK